jgi:hypothetical protein
MLIMVLPEITAATDLLRWHIPEEMVTLYELGRVFGRRNILIPPLTIMIMQSIRM